MVDDCIQHDNPGRPSKIRKLSEDRGLARESTMTSPVLEQIQMEHVPSTHTVHLGIFKDVANAEFLQQQLLSRNSEYEYAFIDASSVCDILSL